MRRASTCLAVLGAVLGLGVLALPGIASATPVVTVKVKVVPIEGFPSTGYILGHGAAETFEFTIAGTEGALDRWVGSICTGLRVVEIV